MHCSSTNIDETEIAQAFQTKIDLGESAPKYANTEWVYIDDKNKGNYAGNIRFDTMDLKDRQPVIREGYAMFPIEISSSVTATPYDATTRLAFKTSVLSIIRTLYVAPMGNGEAFVNEIEGQLPIMNNLRLLTESDLDWIDCSGQELHYFGCDRAVDPNVLSDLQSVTPTASSLSQSVPTNEVFGNERLSDRIAIMSNQSARSDVTPWARLDPTRFQLILCIPLKFIHPFFDQLGFPLPNCPLKIEFGLSSLSSGMSDYMPITCPKTDVVTMTVTAAGVVGAAQAAIAAPLAPKLAINPAITIRGFTPGACRLYFKCVTFDAEDGKKMDSALTSGYKKQITYLTTDIVMDTAVATTVAGKSYHRVFAENTKRPVRVWALFPQTGTLAATNNCFPATIGTCYLQDVNLKLNGSTIRKVNYASQRELYNELREYQLGSGYATIGGAAISLNDFMNGVNPQLFDVSRNVSVINNMPITFTFDGKLTDPNSVAVDPIFLIQRYKTAFFNISKSSVTTDAWDGLVSKKD